MKADETGELPRLDAAFASRAAQLDPALQELADRRGLSVAGIARALRGDLDRIARYAMRWEPERRYAGAGAMADDLRRYLRGEAVSAMEASLRYRAGKFLRRHRIAVLAGLMFALMLTLSTAIAWRDAERLRVAQTQILTALDLVQQVFLGADPICPRARTRAPPICWMAPVIACVSTPICRRRWRRSCGRSWDRPMCRWTTALARSRH